MKQKYKIIRESNLELLNKILNKKISKGWKTKGSIAIDKDNFILLLLSKKKRKI